VLERFEPSYRLRVVPCMGDYSNTIFADIDVEGLGALGERIYAEKYKAEFERKYWGKFAEIDLTTEKAYVGDTRGEARVAARKEDPTGFLYLVRIGYSTVDRWI
jgi:hypothetical protein